MSDDAIAWGMDALVIVLAIGSAWVTAKGLRTGVAKGRYGRKAALADNPTEYWKKIWMLGLSAAALTIFAIALTVRMIVRGAA
jgi:hypothetical protein